MVWCVHHMYALRYEFAIWLQERGYGESGGGLNEVPRVVYVFCS